MRPPCPAGSSSRAAQPPLQAGTQTHPKLSTTSFQSTNKRARSTVWRHAPLRAATLDSGTIESQAPSRQPPPEELVSSSARDGGAADSAAAGDNTVMVTFRFPGALEGQEVSVIGRFACGSARLQPSLSVMAAVSCCCLLLLIASKRFANSPRAQARSATGRSLSRCGGHRRPTTS